MPSLTDEGDEQTRRTLITERHSPNDEEFPPSTSIGSVEYPKVKPKATEGFLWKASSPTRSASHLSTRCTTSSPQQRDLLRKPTCLTYPWRTPTTLHSHSTKANNTKVGQPVYNHPSWATSDKMPLLWGGETCTIEMDGVVVRSSVVASCRLFTPCRLVSVIAIVAVEHEINLVAHVKKPRLRS